jgi:elongation factor Ts
MDISSELVKELREKTGAGILDCKKALTEVSGNMEKAVEYLRKKGLASAQKKATRATKDGLVGQYIHAGGKLGVLVEVSCETDFVARTEEFQAFVRDMAMHIAAANPMYVRREDVPAKILESEKEIYRSQALESKKPEAVIEKIVTGKVESYFRDTCLLEQQFVKNPDKTIQNVLTDLIAKLGENMSIRRFVRFQLGETSST